MSPRQLPLRVVLAVLLLFGLGSGPCFVELPQNPFFRFRAPQLEQLSQTGSVRVVLRVPPLGEYDQLAVRLVPAQGDPTAVDVTPSRGRRVEGSVLVPEPGDYGLEADLDLSILHFFRITLRTRTHFETAHFENPDECEVLNSAHCLLPYPSSRFLQKDPSTPTGLRLTLPASGLPKVKGDPLDPAPFASLDGTSPVAQILMHFPGGVDLAASNAPLLRAPGPVPTAPPWVDVRTLDARSVDSDSPTLLIRARTGERVLHFVELDARAMGKPERQALVMRPGASLVPGERYIVAVRGLLHADGTPVAAEPAFAALRDRRPSDVEGISSRRWHFEREIFSPLARAGVTRSDLQLAFDFTVQSDEGLTAEMLSMRDQSFAWLDERIELREQTFDVTSIEEYDCADPGQPVWRIVRGLYDVPLFLSADPQIDAMAVGTLERDADGVPRARAVTSADFTVSLPCSAAVGVAEARPVVLGHGLFGEGEGMVTGFAGRIGEDAILGATDWRGLSGAKDPQGKSDFDFVLNRVVGTSTSQLNNFAALPDRLRQGQLNTLVLARMMKLGAFNLDAAFQRSDGAGAFPGPDTEMFYYGISLGGIMGSMFAALSPDVERLNVDVPAMNFGMLLQRSTQFGLFEIPLALIGLTDPMDVILGLGLINELWVRGEPAGYARHITGLVDEPLPGTNPKRILMTVAWLDKQVSNQASETLARTLGIPNHEGSVQRALQQIPDASGPQDSALVIYDAGSFDLWNVAHQPFIPPLANVIPSSKCDPHARRLLIPASIDQLLGFLQPAGRVENFCDGVCDAGIAYERPEGVDTVCDPLQ